MERNSEQFHEDQEQDKVSTTFNVVLEVLARATRQIKGYELERKKSKYPYLLVIWEYTYLALKILPENVNSWWTPSAKWLDTILAFRKSVAPLYTHDTLNEKETRETIPFPIALTNINYLGVILTNQVRHGYDKNATPWKK